MIVLCKFQNIWVKEILIREMEVIFSPLGQILLLSLVLYVVGYFLYFAQVINHVYPFMAELG